MNILYLTMNPNRQSTTVPTEEWFRLLPSEGLFPVLVSRELGDFAEWVQSEGHTSYQNDLPWPNKRWPIPYFKSLYKLQKLIKRHNIDLIHCNEQNIYPIGKALGKRAKIPVVVSVHFTLGRGFCKWAFGGNRQPDWTFFLSEGSRDACKPATDSIIPETKSSVLYNGLDLTTFKPDSIKRESFRHKHGLTEKIVVGTACALRPRKQIEHLFQSVKAAENDKIAVVLAGGPISEDRAYAKELLASGENLLGDQLIVLGHQDDLTGFFNGLDIFINTSKEEACSISVIEAMSQGCPVLGYPSKSVHTQILPNGGEIVEQDDLNSLIYAIRSWASNPKDLYRRRIQARKQAELKFDSRSLSKQLLETYQKVLREF